MWWSLGGAFIVSLGLIAVTHWVYRWRHPKCNGVLPPGSMGLPLIGETFQFWSLSKSADIYTPIKTRISTYGSIFKTNILGQKVVVSSDPEFNYYLLQQEGKLVELWYMDSISKIFGIGESSKPNSISSIGKVHKFIRNSTLKRVGIEALKEKILPQMEDASRKAINSWVMSRSSVEIKRATTAFLFDMNANLLIGYDPAKIKEKNFGERFTHFFQSMMSLPINLPGTTFHRCMQDQKTMKQIMKGLMEERMTSPEKRRGDLLDHFADGMKTESFVTEEFALSAMFAVLFAAFDTISSSLCMAIMYLSDHPHVLKEVEREHEQILQRRSDGGGKVTWDEYKSMTFTMHVVNETIRLAGISAAILRRAITDIPVNGFTIPRGWTIWIHPQAIHLSPEAYTDPLSFNPWRWKDLGPSKVAKNFIPFGGGLRTCAGSEFAKAFTTIFLHVLVSEYKWEKVKDCEITRNPFLGFGDGVHIKFFRKDNEKKHEQAQ